MFKFLAILRDSLRETLDYKILYVTIGLSLLTILAVASISYEPVSVQDLVETKLKFLNGMIAQHAPPQGGAGFILDGFKRLDGPSEPWLADYEFNLEIRSLVPPGEAAKPEHKKARADAIKQMPDMIRIIFGDTFRKLEIAEVTPTKPLEKDEDTLAFRITTVGGTKSKSKQEWNHRPTLFFGALPLPIPLFSMTTIINFIGIWIIGTFGGAVMIALGVVISASFLPSMLTRGTIDMLLVKPMWRSSLLVYKFIGGLFFVFINTAIIMIGLWLVIGWRTDVWLSSLLISIFVFTFEFAILYSVSALAAVLTRSTIVCILVSFAAWIVLLAIGWAHYWFIVYPNPTNEANKSHWASIGFDWFYRLTPRYNETDWLTRKMIQTDLAQVRPGPRPPESDTAAREGYDNKLKRAEEIHKDQLKALDEHYRSYDWTTCLISSSAFIAVMLSLACWRFSVKDY
jgi:ABC-type transport system involved in multi-copper enzyme maturation permease subunit